MVKLRILEILESQNHTKYWLFKQLDLSPVGDLFEKVEDPIDD